MKKIFFIFCFAVFLSGADFYSLIQEVVQINQSLQNQTDAKMLIQASKQKEELMQEIVQSIIKNQIPSFGKLDLTIGELKGAISNTIQNPYSLAINSLELHSLISQKALLECAQTLSKRNHFFTTHIQVKGEITQTIQTISEEIPISTEGLNKQELEDYKKRYASFEVMAGSYIEVLNFLKNNVDLILPKSFWSSFDLGVIINKVLLLLPDQIQYPAVVKLIFSSVIFAIFFLLRHLITHLLIKSIGMLSRFLDSQEVQEQIRKQIATPILWVILLVSFNLSLDILFYPHAVSPKFKMWLNVCFIITLSWLSILLFKGYGIAILGGLAQRNNSFRREVINLLLKVTYFFIVVIAILVLLKNFGFNVSALIASLGIGGLAVAFAVKDMLANFFASVVLLFDNSFNQGDWIVCGEIEGTVVEIGLRRTTIRTFDNAMLFVPNSLLANGSVRNWSRRKRGRRIRFQIGVTYSSTPDQIRACVRDIQLMLLKHPKIAKEADERQPLSHYELDLKSNIVSMDDLLGYKHNLFVVLDEFAGSSINILVYCFSTTIVWGEWLDVRQDVMLKIMDILKSHNLDFAFPSQSLYIEKMPVGGGEEEEARYFV